MKTKFRTPRKILSVFLCILMLTTSVVIANPFTASAATAFNINSSGGDTFLFKYWFYYGDEDPDQGFWCPLEVTFDVSNDVTVLGANATNSKIVCISTEVENRLESGPYYDGRCDVTSFPHGRVKPGETFSGRTYCESALIYINTTRICNLYDQVTATYGSINSDEYSASSWANYLAAYNVVKDYVTNGIHVTGTSVEDMDLQAKLTVACNNLETAIANLKHAEVSLRDVYKQVTGATLSGSDVIEIRKYFPVTVQLQEGYTNSNPQVRVLYNDGSYKDFTGTKSGNTVTYNIIINGTNVKSITPTGVTKNTYIVKIPTSKTGLSISGGGDKSVTHGGSVSFSVTKQTGYTQATPVVKVDGTQIGGVQNGDTYTYTISGITGNKTVTIDDMPINTYTVKVPTSATGLSITNGGDNTVNYNGSFSFEVTRGEAYTQRTPVVKVNDTVISPSATNGNTFTYTISGITENKTVTIDNLAINTYTVKVPTSATGLSITNGGENTVNYNDSFTFEVTRGTAYTQSTPVVKVNGAAITGTQNGNLFTYTISGIKENKTVTIDNLPINTYKVTVPTSATGLTITNGGDNTVTYGADFSFTVTKKTGYTQATPVVKVDGTQIAGVLSGDTYTYTISNVTVNKKVTVETQPVNSYDISYNLGEGTTADGSPAKIEYFDTKEIKITVGVAYTQSEPKPTVDNGSLTFKEQDGNTYVYTLSAPFGDEPKTITVTVPALAKNTYSAVLPYDKTAEASYKVTNAKADANNVVSGIVYGTDLTFGIDLAKQYNRSNVVVKYNDTVLTPTAGVYTIKNVTGNIEDGEIVVEGVELNHYYITLPLETETGFVIEVGEGLNAKSVLSRTDFNFKFFLDPAYSDSTPTIKVSRDGGDHYSVLTKKDGKYTIENVLSDCIVVVEGVKKNTYTVNFNNEDGSNIKKYTNVEYGSEVKFTGTEPTKATVLVSDETKDGVRVVVERKYEFVGWSADTSYVTSNMDVTPIFEVTEVTTTTPVGGGESETVVTKKTANILFISDEVIIHKETVEKGQAFSGWAEVPVKTSSNPYETYEFLGWDIDKDGKADYEAGESNAIADVQDDVTFVAVFKSNLPTQTVNFYSFDGSKLLYTANVKRGERAAYGLSGAPSRADKAYEYTFEGWSYDKYADETTVLDKIVVGENDITVYAAYSKEVIIYTYKYINDGVELQSGTYNFADGKPDEEKYYEYTGETPVRASTKEYNYTFDKWRATTPDRYSTVYVATYTPSTRVYDYALPTGETYTIALDESVGEKIPYNGNLTFTVTLDEGYTQTAPVVTSNGSELEYEKSGENSYVFTIVADGADADEIKAKLTKITVETAINHYNVAISGDSGADISTDGFWNTEYNSNGTFTVTLKEGYTQNAPVVTAAEGDRVVITLDKAEGNVYTYTVSEIKSNATITVATKINEYPVVLKNWDGKDVFNGNVKHGEAPVYKTPTKPIDANGQYDFVGWDTDGDGAVDVTTIENVTAPVTAKAVYNYNHRHDSDPADPDSVWELVKTDRANCTKSGMKYYVCKHCGEQTKNVVIPARGHKWTAEGEGWIIVKAPTCTETGLKSRYCCNEANDDYDACNYKEENVVVPATGHHDSDGDYICDDCGFDLGHCSKCICHKGNILSKVLRYICTLLTKTFHKPIKCCKCMDWYGGNISSIS